MGRIIAFYATLSFIVAYVLAWLGSAFVAAWTEHERLGNVAILGFFVGLPIVAFGSFVVEELGPPKKPLPRAQRKILKEREAELRLEQSIAEMEDRAGVERSR